MSGSQNLTVDDRIKQIEREIEKYQQDEFDALAVSKFANLTLEEIRGLTPEDCGAISTLLAQAAFYIQKQQNIEVAKRNWADKEINRLVAKEVDQYNKFTPYEVKKNQIIQNSEALRRLYDVFLNASKKADSLYMLSSHIKFIADTLIEQQITKRSASYNGYRGNS